MLSEKFTYRKLAGVTLCVMGTVLVTLRDAVPEGTLGTLGGEELDYSQPAIDGEEPDYSQPPSPEAVVMQFRTEWVARAIQVTMIRVSAQTYAAAPSPIQRCKSCES